MIIKEKYTHIHQKPIEYIIEKNGCYKCISHKQYSRGGYPLLKRKGNRLTMSRYIWKLKHKNIKNNLFILHNCNNKSCININHLRLGTNQDNMFDAIKIGLLIGENSHSHKITYVDVKKIRNIKNKSLREIGEMFGLGTSQIWRIRKNLSWTYIKQYEASRGESQ